MVLKKQFDEAAARTELNSNQFEELICNTSSKENRKIDVSLWWKCNKTQKTKVLRRQKTQEGTSKELKIIQKTFWEIPFNNKSSYGFIAHPWAGEDLSLKIDERDQTIWNCILES